MIVIIQYIQDLILWKSVCPHHFPTLGHIFSLLHHYEICCVHCLCLKQLALFLCREGCGSYMHQAHSSSCSLSSLAEVAREDNLWLLRQNGHNHMALCSSTAYIASIIECVVVSPLAKEKNKWNPFSLSVIFYIL
ncbi:uncharacterized protein LOC106777468 [Vigna radiata var. radiata]|uniref:Uncharacterized protein LOC106777468 n=1 Tax=Vigna radiata var. radiata TaxID=3916 RepID=A0A3Q0EQW9_VIGRR|nr:uncharacterized protein LOC106777468 [Vigna radiata var. radiata]